MAANRTDWVSVLSDCLAALEREQIGSSTPVVDHEVTRSADGGPDDMTAWLICRTGAEQRQFADNELARTAAALKRKMLAAGFPESAVASLRLRVTSRDDVQHRGGYSALR